MSHSIPDLRYQPSDDPGGAQSLYAQFEDGTYTQDNVSVNGPPEDDSEDFDIVHNN